MPFRCHPLTAVLCCLICVVVSFLSQLIALTTTWWATFSARVDTGKPKEDGHYGLWLLCSTKAPHWKEDCDPLDTFFQVPTYSQVSGVICIVHLLIVFLLLPIELVWAAQVFRNLSKLNPKILCIVKVLAALTAVFLASLVAIFISIGEYSQTEYTIEKGWSFWLQIFVICMDVLISTLFFIENHRFWRQHTQQQVDPDGKRAETYGNPTFDTDSPELPRYNHITNGAVAYTETSGRPYDSNIVSNGSVCGHQQAARAEGGNREEKHSVPEKQENKAIGSLTYENNTFQDSSPGAVRKTSIN